MTPISGFRPTRVLFLRNTDMERLQVLGIGPNVPLRQASLRLIWNANYAVTSQFMRIASMLDIGLMKRMFRRQL